MSVTEITIERTTGSSIFENDQSDPSLTREQADIVAERYMDLLLDRLERAYPDATIEVVAGNGLGGGTTVTADTWQEENEALAALSSISDAINESDDLWSVVA